MDAPTLQMSELRTLKGKEPIFFSTGIYAITNSINGRMYIGQTMRSFIWRWRSHRSVLRMGYHSSKPFQYDWSVYGESAFVCSVLEELQSSDAIESCEEAYIVQWSERIGVRKLYNSLSRFPKVRERFNVTLRMGKENGIVNVYHDE